MYITFHFKKMTCHGSGTIKQQVIGHVGLIKTSNIDLVNVQITVSG